MEPTRSSLRAPTVTLHCHSWNHHLHSCLHCSQTQRTPRSVSSAWIIPLHFKCEFAKCEFFNLKNCFRNSSDVTQPNHIHDSPPIARSCTLLSMVYLLSIQLNKTDTWGLSLTLSFPIPSVSNPSPS